MLKTRKHIEARAGRCQQDDVARLRRLKRKCDRLVHVLSSLARSQASQFAFNRFCVLAYQNQLPNPLAYERYQWSVGCFLSAATKNQNDLSGFVSECFHRFDSRIDAGGFRIVVEFYALNFCNKLQPMLDRFEIPNRLTHRIRSGAASQSGSDCCQHIFDIVQAPKFHLIRLQQYTLATGRTRNDLAASQEEPFFQFSLDTERRDMRA